MAFLSGVLLGFAAAAGLAAIYFIVRGLRELRQAAAEDPHPFEKR